MAERGIAMTRLGAALAFLAIARLAVTTFGASGSANAAQFRRCSPVVGRAPSGGFDRAVVLVVAGKIDCEKSRRQIWSALYAKSYSSRQIGGWTCSSTGRVGSGHLYGATCVREGEEREAVRSTTPKPCHNCSSIRA